MRYRGSLVEHVIASRGMPDGHQAGTVVELKAKAASWLDPTAPIRLVDTCGRPASCPATACDDWKSLSSWLTGVSLNCKYHHALKSPR